MLAVLLLTRGADQVSGGHLFHRRLVAAAPGHDATITLGRERLLPRLPRGWDVIVVDSIAAWRLAVAMLGRRPPVVAMVHQVPGGTEGSRLGRQLRRSLDVAVYRRCDLVLAASSTLQAALVDHHGLERARVRVVPPGCDLPAGRASEDLRRGRRIALISVANWLPNKGVLALLDAVAALAPDDVTLHLVGRDDVDPRYAAQVRRRLRAPDLVGRVVVHGLLDQSRLADLYAGADVFALASTSEGYATVCAEALAAGLPIVGWRRDFLERLVTDGVEGRLVPPDDIDALRDALRDLARDDIARQALTDAARRRGADLPTWADTAAGFFGALREVTTRRG